MNEVRSNRWQMDHPNQKKEQKKDPSFVLGASRKVGRSHKGRKMKSTLKRKNALVKNNLELRLGVHSAELGCGSMSTMHSSRGTMGHNR